MRTATVIVAMVLVAVAAAGAADDVAAFNRQHILPHITSLLDTRITSHFELSLTVACPFWEETEHCAVGASCATTEERAAQQRELRRIDRELDAAHARMSYRSPLDRPWGWEPSNGDTQPINLLENPEQHTGYAGASPHRIWNEIHSHNLYHDDARFVVLEQAPEEIPSEDDAQLAAMPAGRRMLNQIVSGLHSSISAHIAGRYHLAGDRYGPNLIEYERRLGFDEQRRDNLRRTYLAVLLAVRHAGPALRRHFANHAHASRALDALLRHSDAWPASEFAEVQTPHDMRARVYNMTKLTACVACDRCRIWATTQFNGLATAMRILFAPHRQDVLSALSHNNVVALLNLLGRLSESVDVVRRMQPMVRPQDAQQQLSSGTTLPVIGMPGQTAPVYVRPVSGMPQ